MVLYPKAQVRTPYFESDAVFRNNFAQYWAADDFNWEMSVQDWGPGTEWTEHPLAEMMEEQEWDLEDASEHYCPVTQEYLSLSKNSCPYC